MNKNSVKVYFLILIIFSVSLTRAEAEQSFSLRTGLCQFEYTQNQQSALAGGVTASFFETVKSVTEHQVGPDEIKVLLLRDKEKEIDSKVVALEKLYSERDEIIFYNSGSRSAGDLQVKDSAIEKVKVELEQLQAQKEETGERIDRESYSIIPVEFVQPENGLFFKREAGEIAETAEKNNLDIIIYGFVENLDDYQYIEVRLWNNLLQKDTIVWRTAVSSDDVISLIIPGQKIIKTDLLGKEWAELTVIGPDNCLIYIDGKFTGIGRINRLIFDPGSRLVEVKKSGYESHSEKIYLNSFEGFVLDIELEIINNRSIVIQTFPAQADVYLDSVWMGKSPVRLQPENETSTIRIKKDGYIDKSFFVDGNTENIVNINLKADSNGREQWVPGRRARFYTGLGSFVMSIPFTALFYSMVEQTGEAYLSEYAANGVINIDELTRLQNLNTAQYSMYLASLGLNIFFFLDTVLQAVEYVGSVEYFSD